MMGTNHWHCTTDSGWLLPRQQRKTLESKQICKCSPHFNTINCTQQWAANSSFETKHHNSVRRKSTNKKGKFNNKNYYFVLCFVFILTFLFLFNYLFFMFIFRFASWKKLFEVDIINDDGDTTVGVRAGGQWCLFCVWWLDIDLRTWHRWWCCHVMLLQRAGVMRVMSRWWWQQS